MLGLRPGLLRASFGDLALGVLTVSSADDDAEAFEGVAPQLEVLATAGDVASSLSGLTLLRVARPE